jgi:hypothetical protein
MRDKLSDCLAATRCGPAHPRSATSDSAIALRLTVA